MTEIDSQDNQTTEVTGVLSQASRDKWMLAGLAAISIGTIITEIALTKFISYKLFYHFTYAIVSLVMFAFGLAGVTVFMRPDKLGADSNGHWWNTAQASFAFAWSLALAIGLYCFLPMHNYQYMVQDEAARLPFYGSYVVCVLMFGVPFYLAGLVVSQILSATTKSLTLIYFVDLVAAALGALITPTLLEQCGGFGTMLIACLAGVFAAFSFSRLGAPPKKAGWLKHAIGFVLAIGFMYWAPAYCLQTAGCDIVSWKDPAGGNFFNQFGGLERTYWNAIARIDVSKTSEKSINYFGFSYGLSPEIKKNMSDLSGRYILVDGCANTRQLKLDTPTQERKYLGTNLFATPYVAHGPTDKALIIGAGGGIDIQVAKFFGVTNVDVVELNPSTYKLLTGTVDDPQREIFVNQLKSTDKSHVNIMLDEARHLCSRTPAGTYDVIHAGGVDTLAAIASGGMSLCENYLYTTDAVRVYYSLLKPGGMLSLTHWRVIPPHLGLRMFDTYLSALEQMGIKEPSKQIMSVAGDWTVNLLKTTPFTDEEAERVRQWAQGNGFDVVFDPTRPTQAPRDPKEAIFQQMAVADSAQRAKLIHEYILNIEPTTDDNPYFYRTFKPGFKQQITHTEDITHNQLVVLALFGVALLIWLPLRAQQAQAKDVVRRFGPFFALCGFGFLLFETSIMQVLNIFVGGPMYSMAVTLVAVLGGYGVGSWLGKFFKLNAGFFAMLGALLCLLFLICYSVLVPSIHTWMSLDNSMRMLVAAIVTLILSVPTGMLVPMGADAVRKIDKNAVAWMWGINSGFNVLGGVSYVWISQMMGIRATFLVVAFCYLAAGLWVMFFFPKDEAEPAVETTDPTPSEA